MKRHGQFLSHNKIEMGEGRCNEDYSELIGKGRVRVLLQALEDFKRRGMEGQRSSSPPVPVGRVGIVPRGFMGRNPCMCVARGRDFPSS